MVLNRLEGRSALITGAARGIGAQIAKRFSEEGAAVIINDLNLDAAQATADALGGWAIACDVSDPDAVNAMFGEVAKRTERLDILVNNAGISGLEGDDVARERLQKSYKTDVELGSNEPAIQAPPILDVSNEAWLKMLAVHLNGTFYCSRAAVRLMIRDSKKTAGGAAIINMGSIMGTSGGAGAAAYCAAKAGVLGFSRSLARELAEYNVRVNALAPGHIHTDMISSLDAMFPALIAQTPMGRIGDTDDIAWAAVYLASDEAKFVTGQTLSPNGGWHMSQ